MLREKEEFLKSNNEYIIDLNHHVMAIVYDKIYDEEQTNKVFDEFLFTFKHPRVRFSNRATLFPNSDLNQNIHITLKADTMDMVIEYFKDTLRDNPSFNFEIYGLYKSPDSYYIAVAMVNNLAIRFDIQNIEDLVFSIP